MAPHIPLALAFVVAAQTVAVPVVERAQTTPAWLAALLGVGGAIATGIAGWFAAKTKAEKNAALANTINAIPTAWTEVLKANPGVPHGTLIGKVLEAAAAFAGRALTAAEQAKAKDAVVKHTPTTALADAVAASLRKGSTP